MTSERRLDGGAKMSGMLFNVSTRVVLNELAVTVPRRVNEAALQ